MQRPTTQSAAAGISSVPAAHRVSVGHQRKEGHFSAASKRKHEKQKARQQAGDIPKQESMKKHSEPEEEEKKNESHPIDDRLQAQHAQHEEDVQGEDHILDLHPRELPVAPRRLDLLPL